MAAAPGFALSDAAPQNCIPTPGAICQSKKGKDTGREAAVVEGRKEAKKG